MHGTLTTKVFEGGDVTALPGERAVTAVISSTAVDRDGEVLVAQGCNSKDFEANPLCYLNHDYWTLPVGKWVALKRHPDRLTAKLVFAERPPTHPADQEWPPDTLFSLYQQGVIRGFSVGFECKESRPATYRDIEKYGEGCRRVISKWTLFEVSCAPLPCNQEALAVAVSKGLLTQSTAKKWLTVDAKVPAQKPIVMTLPKPVAVAVAATPVKRIVHCLINTGPGHEARTAEMVNSTRQMMATVAKATRDHIAKMRGQLYAD